MSETNKFKYLIINADDFGYCPERNRGIKEAFLNNKITSATLLVNGLFAKEASQFVIENNIPIGLHFNITEGKPICSAQQISSLCDDVNGLFLGKFGFRNALETNQIDPEHIRLELKAQIRRFIELTGNRPTHIDSHQHIHVHPNVIDIFADELHRNDILWTRVPCEQLSGAIPDDKIQFYKSILDNCNLAKKKLNSLKISYTKSFVGLTTMGSLMTQESLRNSLVRAFSDVDLVELMVHPGYPSIKNIGGCDNTLGPDEFSMSLDRLNELNQLSSYDFLDFLNKNHIKLINFSFLK